MGAVIHESDLHELEWTARALPMGSSMIVSSDVLLFLIDGWWRRLEEGTVWDREAAAWHQGYGAAVDDLNNGDLQPDPPIRVRETVDVDTKGRT